MNIAIMGASATGKTALAQALTAQLPHLGINEAPPLMCAQSDTPAPSLTAWQTLISQHRLHFDVTLLMGLDLPCPTHLQPARQAADTRLRATLQQAGLAFGVVYGKGPDRLRHALRLIMPQDAPPVRWRGVCEKCADPECELRLFTALKNSKAAAQPLA